MAYGRSLLRLQREKANEMELRQFSRFVDEKMVLDAAESGHLCALVARCARRLALVRSRLHTYQQTCLRLGISQLMRMPITIRSSADGE
uniref:GTD-binding domain-containing protein n=1 Tax=Aegilops tauschii subsp. strangulata TaxID=200361 RepID=A0A452YFW8_AEGTS